VIRAVWRATGVKASRVPIWKAGIASRSYLTDAPPVGRRPALPDVELWARKQRMHKAWTQAHPSLLLHSLSLLLQMRLWTITAITAMGATFQKATRHYLYHLSHMTGLGVYTVSDEESPLHRAMVKLTWTTRQSGARVAQSSGRWRWLSHPLVPRRGRAQCLRMFRVAGADAGGRPDLGRGGGCWLHLQSAICNLTASKPWPWNIATKRCIWSSVRGWRRLGRRGSGSPWS